MTVPFTLSGVDVVLPADAPLHVWEAERRNGIGGSDVASAAGIGYDSPYTVWAEKTGRARKLFTEDEEERMRVGHLLEPIVRDEFRRRHPEFVVTESPGTLAVPGQHWQRVNVDGLVWTRDGELAGVLECKTGTHQQLQVWADKQVPVPYTSQVQWAMHVTGAPRGYVLALLDTSTFIPRVLERDQYLIDTLVELAAVTWRHVLADEAPEPDGSESTRRTLSDMPARPGSSLVLPERWVKHFRARAELAAHIAALKNDLDELDNITRAALGDNEEAWMTTPDGKRVKVATHKAPADARRCDLDELSEKFPQVYDAMVVTVSSSRRLNYSRAKAAKAFLGTTTTIGAADDAPKERNTA